jgi:hypothetical protein
MTLDWEKIGPDTPVSELTAGELLEIIGWALTGYKAGEAGDVAGFGFTGHKPNLPEMGPRWATFQPQYWSKKPSAGRRLTAR